VPDVSLEGLGIVLLHRGDPPSVDGARDWLTRWYADPYAFKSSFGRGTQRFFGSLASRFDAATWKTRLSESGGTSPLNGQANELAQLLEKKLSLPVRFATLYSPPLVKDAVEQLKAAGARRIAGLTLYPQKSERFTRPLIRALEEVHPDATFIDRFGTAKGYVEALRASINEGLERAPGATVLFCALPIERADEAAGDPYPEQLRETTAAVMEGMVAPWRVAWMGDGAPGTPVELALKAMRSKGTDAVVMVPLGSAVDELVTVHMLDVQMRQTARTLGFTRVERARPPVGYSAFVEALATELKSHFARLAQLGFVS
jgi:ferrochelatase